MDMDFKLSFLAKQTSRPETSLASELKTRGSSSDKSFESTLRSKRNEVESRNGNGNDKSADDVRKNEKTQPKEDTPVKENVKEKEDAEVKKEDAPERTQTDNGRKTEEKLTEDTVKEKAAEIAEENGESKKDVELSEEEEAELVAKIAETLGVTPEQVVQALKSLNIEPETLSEPENINKLIMSVNEMKEPAELLKLPELTAKQKEIAEAVAKVIQESNTKLEKTSVETQTQATGQTDAETQTKAAPKPETTELTAAPQAAQTTEETAEASTKPVVKAENAVQEKVPHEEAKAPKIAEVTEDAETLEAKETDKPAKEAPQKTNDGGSALGNQAQNGSGGRFSGGAGSTEGDKSVQAVTASEGEHTPVVIQKGDETIVEAGGRTISRTAASPRTQAADVLNQIMDKMKLELKPGITELKINLKPDELGNLTIKVVTESGHVTAEIVTENSKVKELVEQNISALKESLRQQGVEVGELSVSVGQQETGERMNQFMMEQRKSQARMSQIINRITGEEMSLDTVNYADETEINGSSVDFSA